MHLPPSPLVRKRKHLTDHQLRLQKGVMCYLCVLLFHIHEKAAYVYFDIVGVLRCGERGPDRKLVGDIGRCSTREACSHKRTSPTQCGRKLWEQNWIMRLLSTRLAFVVVSWYVLFMMPVHVFLSTVLLSVRLFLLETVSCDGESGRRRQSRALKWRRLSGRFQLLTAVSCFFFCCPYGCLSKRVDGLSAGQACSERFVVAV